MADRKPEDVLAATRRFYANGEREPWEQTDTPHALTDEQLRSRRKRDNVDRPSRVSGAEYMVALNTCAVLAGERDKALAMRDIFASDALLLSSDRAAARAERDAARAEAAEVRRELERLRAAVLAMATRVSGGVDINGAFLAGKLRALLDGGEHEGGERG